MLPNFCFGKGRTRGGMMWVTHSFFWLGGGGWLQLTTMLFLAFSVCFFQSASPTTRTDCPPEDEAAPAAVKEAVCEVDTAR